VNVGRKQKNIDEMEPCIDVEQSSNYNTTHLGFFLMTGGSSAATIAWKFRGQNYNDSTEMKTMHLIKDVLQTLLSQG
jgi:hypothetical protein